MSEKEDTTINHRELELLWEISRILGQSMDLKKIIIDLFVHQKSVLMLRIHFDSL